MVILEPDGTLAQDASREHEALDLVVELLSHRTERSQGAAHYACDVLELGTVALQIEPEAGTITGNAPRRFTGLTVSRR